MRNTLLPTVGAVALALSLAPSAHAGPTLDADLDLGTSVERQLLGGTARKPLVSPLFPQSPLYVVGFRVRAGWRFHLGTAFLAPEIGGGYDTESPVTVCEVDPAAPQVGFCQPVGRSLATTFGGARAGLSFALTPTVAFEPGIYGHVGYARYLGGPGSGAANDGLASDVGLSLDLRIVERFVVGTHLGYDVVTTWQSLGTGASSKTLAVPDSWVGYGIHAGVLFW